jgi:hypothetical protein
MSITTFVCLLFLALLIQCCLHEWNLNTDSLPFQISRRLRNNNNTLQLSDTDGDRWIALSRHAQHDPEFATQLMSGPQHQLKINICQVLGVSQQDTFHTNRFLGLWRHDEYRKLCSAWCETSVGRASFSLLTFSRLKEFRIANVRSFPFFLTLQM